MRVVTQVEHTAMCEAKCVLIRWIAEHNPSEIDALIQTAQQIIEDDADYTDEQLFAKYLKVLANE